MKKFLLVFVLLFLIGCTGEDDSEFDYDIPRFSSPVAYALLTDILFENPQNYLGKTIRVQGTYQHQFWDVSGAIHHDVVMQLLADCCPKSIEFILSGAPTFPDDFPEHGTEIEISGVFSRYRLLGQWIYYLDTEEIIFP